MNTLSIIFEELMITVTPVTMILLILSCIRRSKAPLIALLLVFAMEGFDSFMRISRHIFYLFGPKNGFMNWQGGVLSILWPLVIVFLFKWLSPKEVGLSLDKPRRDLFLGLAFGIILGGWNFLDEYLRGSLHNLGESTLYMLAIPGLSEELIYRGVLLAILNRYLGEPWNWGGIRFGWDIILVSIIFIDGHLFEYSLSLQQFIWKGSIDLIVNVTIATAAFSYLRLKTRSIWPGAICHSMIDSAPFLSIQ